MTSVNILIAEDIPAKNKGEAALFYGLVESLDCIEDKKLITLSTDPGDDLKYYGHLSEIIDANGIIPEHCVSNYASFAKKTSNYAIFILKHLTFCMLYLFLRRSTLGIFRHPAWRAYLDADIIILGHDSAWSPLYHATMFAVFSMLKKPCFVYAGSVTPSNPLRKGKLYKTIAEGLSRWTLKKACLITLRETISLKRLRAIGLNDNNSKIEVYPDLAYLVPPAKKDRVDEILSEAGIDEGETLVGMAFNQRTLRHAYPDAGSDDVRLSKAIDDIAVLAQSIVDNYSARIVFIPHSIGPTPNLDDRIIARRIIDKMKDSSKVISLEGDYWLYELKGIASRLQLTISSRLHCCIDTLSSEVPALFVTYSTDIRGHGIIGELLGRPDYLCDIDLMQDAGRELISTVDGLWNRREEINRDLEQLLPDVRRDTKKHGSRLFEEYEKFCNRR